MKLKTQSDWVEDAEAKDNKIYDKRIDGIKNDWQQWKGTRNIFEKFFGFFWFLIKAIPKGISMLFRAWWSVERNSGG
jgi:hypothetical protein